MSDRKQPDLTTGGSGGDYRARGNKRPAARKSAGASRGSGGGGGGIGTSLMLAVLVGGLALAGWFIANQQQMLHAEQEKAADAERRLAKLEARLSATDSALAQDGVHARANGLVGIGNQKIVGGFQ